MSRQFRFWAVSAACVATLSFAGSTQLSAQSSQASSKKASATATAASGFYTDAQAERGNKVFSANCLSCHGRKDMSSADFRLKWNGRTVFDLFDRVESTMPESDPGSLSTTEYADVVAYLLKLNGMTAGKKAVAPGAALKQQKLAFPSR